VKEGSRETGLGAERAEKKKERSVKGKGKKKGSRVRGKL